MPSIQVFSYNIFCYSWQFLYYFERQIREMMCQCELLRNLWFINWKWVCSISARTFHTISQALRRSLAQPSCSRLYAETRQDCSGLSHHDLNSLLQGWSRHPHEERPPPRVLYKTFNFSAVKNLFMFTSFRLGPQFLLTTHCSSSN